MTAPAWIWAKSAGSPAQDYAKLDYGSSSIATDEQGNSFVTGSFAGPMTFPGGVTLSSATYPKVFIAKFDTSGTCLWAKEFGGDNTDPRGNQGEAVAIDLRGDCYITGTFHGSIGSTITLKPSVTLTGTGAREIFTVKYDGTGDPKWAQQPVTGNPAANNYGKSIAANHSGKSYTTGYLGNSVTFSGTTLSGAGAYVVKHKRNGGFSWATKIGDGGADAHCVCVSFDSSVYVTGYFQGANTFATSGGNVTLTSLGIRDVFLARLSASGALLWVKQVGLSGTQTVGNGVDADQYGNIYVTGEQLDMLGKKEAIALKFDRSGALIWSKSSTGSSDTSGHAVKVSPCGGCYITGHYQSTTEVQFGLPLISDGRRRTFVAHVDANGLTTWAQTSGGNPNTTAETPMGIATDGQGHIYIAGNAQGAAQFGTETLDVYGTYDAFIAKLDKAQDCCCGPESSIFPWTSGSILDPTDSGWPNYAGPETLTAKFAFPSGVGLDGVAYMGMTPFHRATRLLELSALKLPLDPSYIGAANLDIVVLDYAGTVLRTISTTTLNIVPITDRTWTNIDLTLTPGDLDILPGEVVAGRLTMDTSNPSGLTLVYTLSGSGHFL